MEREKILEAKLQVLQQRYHGMMRDIAAITGLTERTINSHLKPGTDPTSSTREILVAAKRLITNRKEAQRKRLEQRIKSKRKEAQK